MQYHELVMYDHYGRGLGTPSFDDKTNKVITDKTNKATQHSLKISPNYFKDILLNGKTFEIRENDRNYHVGDIIQLHEWDLNEYTGYSIKVKINYISKDVDGIKKKYCVFSFSKI